MWIVKLFTKGNEYGESWRRRTAFVRSGASRAFPGRNEDFTVFSLNNQYSCRLRQGQGCEKVALRVGLHQREAQKHAAHEQAVEFGLNYFSVDYRSDGYGPVLITPVYHGSVFVPGDGNGRGIATPGTQERSGAADRGSVEVVSVGWM